MEYAWTLVIVTVIAGVLTLIGVLLSQKFGKKSDNVLTGIDILQVLRHIKLFPIGPANTWRLRTYVEECRVWTTQLHSSHLFTPVLVHGCYSKVKGSPQLVLTQLKDLSKYPEWTPGIHKAKHLVRSGEPENPPKLISQTVFPVYHDVVSLVVDTSMEDSVIGFVNKVSEKVQGVPLVQAVKEIHRYWCKGENSCCWMLEMNERTQEWAFFLAQPTDGFFEIDQCLISLVTYTPSDICTVEQALHIPARKLGSFCNFFAFRKVQCNQAINISLPVSEEILRAEIEASKQSKNKSNGSPPNRSQEQPSKTESNFIKKFKNMIEEKREWYEERKRKSSPGISPHSQKAEQASSILQQVPSGSLLKEPEIDSQDSPDSGSVEKSEGSTESLSEKGDAKVLGPSARSGSKIERNSILKFLRSQSMQLNGSTTNLNEGIAKSPSEKCLEKDRRYSDGQEVLDRPKERAGSNTTPSTPEIQVKETFASRFMRKVKSLDVPNDKGFDDVSVDTNTEASEYDDDDENLLADEDIIDEDEYRAIADSVASALIAEKGRISHLDITRPYEEQAEQTGGWIYCGLEKDVVILRKIYDCGTPYQCYLGKGLIPAPPKVVFEAVKNPQTRFTYDEMLKKVEVLHDFDNGMRILYLYHEVSQLFRKETRDFCVLQTEQIEGVKYIISIRSVTYPGCPETEDTIRGRFLPSGWIIEPVTKDQKLYSMVTYIVQMELGMSKTNTGYLVEELAAKQPLSIIHLRQLVVPSGSVAKNTVHQSSSGGGGGGTGSSKIRRRSLGGNTLAVAAASNGINRQSSSRSSSTTSLAKDAAAAADDVIQESNETSEAFSNGPSETNTDTHNSEDEAVVVELPATEPT